MKVENGKPIPARGQYGRWKALMARMKPGDNVILDTKRESESFRSSIYAAGYKAVSRKIGGKYVVWLVE